MAQIEMHTQMLRSYGIRKPHVYGQPHSTLRPKRTVINKSFIYDYLNCTYSEIHQANIYRSPV